MHNEQSGPALVRYNWPLAGSNQNQPNTVDQPKPQTPPVNAKQLLSFASSNAAEWSGQGNEVYSPSAHMSLPRKPSKVDQASHKDWLSMPFSDIFNEKLFFGQMEFLPENSVNYDKYWVPMRSMKMAYEMPPPPRPSRKILIRKSKNGYSRERLQQSKDAYWSDVGMQQMKDDRKFKHFNPLPRKPHNFQASRKVRSPRYIFFSIKC